MTSWDCPIPAWDKLQGVQVWVSRVIGPSGLCWGGHSRTHSGDWHFGGHEGLQGRPRRRKDHWWCLESTDLPPRAEAGQRLKAVSRVCSGEIRMGEKLHPSVPLIRILFLRHLLRPSSWIEECSKGSPGSHESSLGRRVFVSGDQVCRLCTG